MLEAIVEKWYTCQSSVVFDSLGFMDNDNNYPPIPELSKPNFACDNPKVVAKSPQARTFLDPHYITGPRIAEAAILHGEGRPMDICVVEALTRWCGNCPYYKPDLNMVAALERSK